VTAGKASRTHKQASNDHSVLRSAVMRFRSSRNWSKVGLQEARSQYARRVAHVSRRVTTLVYCLATTASTSSYKWP
jgi:hypothetical protein